MVVRAKFACPFGQVLHGSETRELGESHASVPLLTFQHSPFAYRPGPIPLNWGEGPRHCPQNPLSSSAISPDSLHRPLLSAARGDTFTINCSGFDQHGVDPAAFQAVFDRKAFRPILNISIPTRVNISFTLSAILEVVSPSQSYKGSNAVGASLDFIKLRL